MSDSQSRSKLESLTKQQREDLIERLQKCQSKNGDCYCYVFDKPINRQVHKIDIDHKIARSLGGADEESNWGLTHDTCNRSKGARDLQLQRYLYEFREDVIEHTEKKALGSERHFTLSEALNKIKPQQKR